MTTSNNMNTLAGSARPTRIRLHGCGTRFWVSNECRIYYLWNAYYTTIGILLVASWRFVEMCEVGLAELRRLLGETGGRLGGLGLL